jgi:hypothetical protein
MIGRRGAGQHTELRFADVANVEQLSPFEHTAGDIPIITR